MQLSDVDPLTSFSGHKSTNQNEIEEKRHTCDICNKESTRKDTLDAQKKVMVERVPWIIILPVSMKTKCMNVTFVVNHIVAQIF